MNLISDILSQYSVNDPKESFIHISTPETTNSGF